MYIENDNDINVSWSKLMAITPDEILENKKLEMNKTPNYFIHFIFQ